MEDEEHQFVLLTANQVVAYNLRVARIIRGWTQTEAAEKLAPHLGVTWSKASYSAAERSVEGGRVRNFSADDLVAFALGFDLPLTWFFLPPDPDDNGRIPLLLTPSSPEGTGDLPGLLLELVFGSPERQVRLEERLDEILLQMPLELRGRYSQLIGRFAGLMGMASMRSVLGDLTVWIHNLTDLAGLLKEVQQQTADNIEQAIDAMIKAYSDDRLEDEEGEEGNPTKEAQP
jgi:transcriptional regulator with XRE-family HTH domain